MLAIGPKVRGFKPGRGRLIFKSGKNPYHFFLQKGNNSVGPMSKVFYYILKNSRGMKEIFVGKIH
jgi:hypothetical protein